METTDAGFLASPVKVSFNEHVVRDQPGGAQARWAC